MLSILSILFYLMWLKSINFILINEKQVEQLPSK